MNRIDICKNIIQSINEYITNPDNLEPHCEKNILSGKENYPFSRSFFIFCILPRLPCFRTFPASARTCLPLTFRPFQNRPFPKQGNSSIPLFSRNFFIFQSICFTVSFLPADSGMVTIFLRLMVPKLSFQTLLPILNSSAKCLAIRTLPGGLPWVSLPSFTMFLTTTSSIPLSNAILLLNVLLPWNI